MTDLAQSRGTAVARQSPDSYLLAGVILLAALAGGLVFADTIALMIGTWNAMGTYSYGWIILPTLAYLVWHNRARVFPARLQPNYGAAALALVMGLGWVVADAAGISLAMQLAMIGGLCTITLAVTGWRALPLLAPYMAMLLLLVPLGDFLLVPLKHLTVLMIRGFAALADLPFENDGFRVIVAGQKYIIVDACAGLGYVLLGLFLGLSLSLMIYRSNLRIALLTLLGGAIGVVTNGLRVSGIILTDHLNGTQMDLSDHSYFELAAVASGFVLLFVIFARLKGEAREQHEAMGASPSVGKSGAKPLLAGLTATALLLAGPLYWQLAAGAAAQADGAEPLSLPQQLSAWSQASDAAPDWAPVARDGSAVATAASYVADGSEMTVYVVEAGGAGTKISGGAVDMTGNGDWGVGRSDLINACNAVAGVTDCPPIGFQAIKLRRKKLVRYAYYTYQIDEYLTTSVLDLRLRRAQARIAGHSPRVRLYVIGTDMDGGLDLAEAGSLLQALAARQD